MAEKVNGHNSHSYRTPWIDYCKVFAIYCVILGHLGITEHLHDYISSFHMPLFFFISGYLYYYKGDFIPFLKKDIKTILLPYYYLNFLVLLVFIPFYYVFGNFSTEYLEDVVKLILLGSSSVVS